MMEQRTRAPHGLAEAIRRTAHPLTGAAADYDPLLGLAGEAPAERRRLAGQFDAVIHIDETSAVQPIDPEPGWFRGELPETFPTGK